MTISREHLAPCPFCGGAVRFHSDEDCPGCHYIECGGCKAMFDFSPTTDPENQCDSLHELQCGIAHVWNTRAQAAPVAEPAAEVSQETFSSDGTSDIITCNLPIGTKLYTAPPHDADHVEHPRAMVDAELVELLKFSSVTMAVTAKSTAISDVERRSLLAEAARIDAKLASLRGVKP